MEYLFQTLSNASETNVSERKSYREQLCMAMPVEIALGDFMKSAKILDFHLLLPWAPRSEISRFTPYVGGFFGDVTRTSPAVSVSSSNTKFWPHFAMETIDFHWISLVFQDFDDFMNLIGRTGRSSQLEHFGLPRNLFLPNGFHEINGNQWNPMKMNPLILMDFGDVLIFGGGSATLPSGSRRVPSN